MCAKAIRLLSFGGQQQSGQRQQQQQKIIKRKHIETLNRRNCFAQRRLTHTKIFVAQLQSQNILRKKKNDKKMLSAHARGPPIDSLLNFRCFIICNLVLQAYSTQLVIV